MRFLIDAQLPRHFCAWLRDAGHDAIHTLDLPLGNRTPDSVLIDIAEKENRIVVTKDDDFVQSHLISNRPSRLLLIATGNISNNALELLVRDNLLVIIAAFSANRFIELGRDTLAVHE
jgi:predicted nuclease of predicted toxin-antitoxin system